MAGSAGGSLHRLWPCAGLRAGRRRPDPHLCPWASAFRVWIRADPAWRQSLERGRLGHAVIRAVWNSGRPDNPDGFSDDRTLGARPSSRDRPHIARNRVDDLRLVSRCASSSPMQEHAVAAGFSPIASKSAPSGLSPSAKTPAGGARYINSSLGDCLSASRRRGVYGELTAEPPPHTIS